MTIDKNDPILVAARNELAEKIIKENGLEGEKGRLWYDVQTHAHIWVPEDVEPQPKKSQIVFDLRRAVKEKTGEVVTNVVGRFFGKKVGE